MSNILEIRNLKVMFGKSIAIHDVSLKVPEGGIVTLIGSNGAGKSTTLNAALGIVKKTQGTVTFNGQDITNTPTQNIVQQGLVLVPEGRHLFPYLSVYKNLILGATQRKDKEGIQADLEYVYELFPILKDRAKQKAGTLSGGQQQMVAIARGMMANPKLLCLDEPSLGLAPAVIEDIGEKIRDIRKKRALASCWWSRTSTWLSAPPTIATPFRWAMWWRRAPWRRSVTTTWSRKHTSAGNKGQSRTFVRSHQKDL